MRVSGQPCPSSSMACSMSRPGHARHGRRGSATWSAVDRACMTRARRWSGMTRPCTWPSGWRSRSWPPRWPSGTRCCSSRTTWKYSSMVATGTTSWRSTRSGPSTRCCSCGATPTRPIPGSRHQGSMCWRVTRCPSAVTTNDTAPRSGRAPTRGACAGRSVTGTTPACVLPWTLQGTLNDDSDVDRGWTVEIALPWAGIAALPGRKAVPPRAGDRWRLFLGRFQKLELSGAEVRPHPAWTWTRQARYDTHRPEEWLDVEFPGRARRRRRLSAGTADEGYFMR